MMDEKIEALSKDELLKMTVDVVSAYLSKNPTPTGHIPDLIQTTFQALTGLDAPPPEPRNEQQRPAVSVKKSIHNDHLVCLEDGKKLKMLKRHLRTNYNMTPEEYRAKWNLPPDYPMVAPNYAQQRSEFAKKIGLGRKSAD
ncbi:MucR family transcriptional regulator [Pararhodospirillum oryzae]|uniref:MucR family transcriptional regulator n=1 Tax=Pararhodospirillum oryzae TaxID=478448 RepID=A0A512HAK5_9PROT|nr:MucR family transcriptional regulator [Pararhodospirillum oryzae]GEO82468.1 MucR family transcriptional regulator [Pararhodospirillum oryzae]